MLTDLLNYKTRKSVGKFMLNVILSFGGKSSIFVPNVVLCMASDLNIDVNFHTFSCLVGNIRYVGACCVGMIPRV